MENRIRKILERAVKLPVDVDQIQNTDDLFDLGLNSFACVQLMMTIEEELQIEYPDHLMNRRSFSSIAQIAEAIAAIHRGAD